MKFYVLASLILFSGSIYLAIRSSKNKQKQIEDSFWDKELRANSVRKKSLDKLAYVTIPLDKLPTSCVNDNSVINECLETLQSLSTQPIVNLTGMSNTDLKLEYGTANLTILSEYDQNYTVLVRTLQKWADELNRLSMTEEAVTVLEYALEIGSDISKTYYDLAAYYRKQGNPFKLEELVEKASHLNTIQKNVIVRTLKESYLYND